MTSRVAVAGGGLAGLTCAKYLVDAGLQVVLYEGLPFLGGRASTYRDPDGEWVEQGLHLFLGVYSEFKTLLNEIGVPPDEVLFWTDELHLQDPDGPAATYGINPLFAPLRTVLSFLGQNDYLGPIDKLLLAPLAAPSLASLDFLRENYDKLSVVEWWRKAQGTEDVLERFIRPFCRAVQFTDAEQFSAYDFLAWVHHSIYGLSQQRLGGYRGARDESVFCPLARYLTDRGAVIRTGTELTEVLYDPAERLVTGFVLAGDQRVDADAYVIAIPAWGFVPLIPGPLRHEPFFAGIVDLPVAPAISVQLWFDRLASETDEFYLVARSYAAVYQEQSLRTYPCSGGRISVIVSPADDLLDWEDQALVKMVVQSLGQVNKDIASAQIRKSVVLKHRRHLIRPLPGAMSSRPTQRTPIGNLFLAGDWTQQDFFGSQEGAVRGGKACAHEVIRSVSCSR